MTDGALEAALSRAVLVTREGPGAKYLATTRRMYYGLIILEIVPLHFYSQKLEGRSLQ
jgi:hypothetical protein